MNTNKSKRISNPNTIETAYEPIESLSNDVIQQANELLGKVQKEKSKLLEDSKDLESVLHANDTLSQVKKAIDTLQKSDSGHTSQSAIENTKNLLQNIGNSLFKQEKIILNLELDIISLRLQYDRSTPSERDKIIENLQDTQAALVMAKENLTQTSDDQIKKVIEKKQNTLEVLQHRGIDLQDIETRLKELINEPTASGKQEISIEDEIEALVRIHNSLIKKISRLKQAHDCGNTSNPENEIRNITKVVNTLNDAILNKINVAKEKLASIQKDYLNIQPIKRTQPLLRKKEAHDWKSLL